MGGEGRQRKEWICAIARRTTDNGMAADGQAGRRAERQAGAAKRDERPPAEIKAIWTDL